MNFIAYGRCRVPKYLRKRIIQRDGGKCLLCGDAENLTIDHNIPISLGGSNRENNLLTLCRKCNQEKDNKIYHQFIRI